MDVFKQCEFIEQDGQCVCKNCGQSVKADCNRLHSNCGEEEIVVEYPSILEIATNFGKAMVDYAKDGFKNVDDEEQARRLKICHSCPLGLYDAEQDRCKGCGCNSTVSSRIRSHDCPKGLWNK